MNTIQLSKKQWILIVGDTLTLLITVAIGFQSHETLSIFLQRFAFTFFPWTLAWIFVAPRFGLFEIPQLKLGKQSVQVVLAMLLVSPLAVVLRAAWLGSAALPLFALIMGASSALALIVWRTIFIKWVSARIS